MPPTAVVLNVGLEEVSRLKGIETPYQRCAKPLWVAGLEEVSRLKGIETMSAAKIAASLEILFGRSFPFEGN